MTATAAPVRPRPPRAASAVPLTAARLLRLELRRNAMPWILPLIAALFWFDSYRPSTTRRRCGRCARSGTWGRGTRSSTSGRSWPAWPPGWGRGTAAAAWATWSPPPPGSRWAAQLATWAATAIWAVAGLPGLRGRHVRGVRPPGRRGRAAVVVGRGRRHGRGGVQRRRVRRRGLVPEPVRRAAGRVRRVPGDGDVVADRVPATPAGGR